MLYQFYKNKPSDRIWWVDTYDVPYIPWQDVEAGDVGDKDKFILSLAMGRIIGQLDISFDRKIIHSLWQDYPDRMTEAEVKEFNRENKYWADFFGYGKNRQPDNNRLDYVAIIYHQITNTDDNVTRELRYALDTNGNYIPISPDVNTNTDRQYWPFSGAPGRSYKKGGGYQILVDIDNRFQLLIEDVMYRDHIKNLNRHNHIAELQKVVWLIHHDDLGNWPGVEKTEQYRKYMSDVNKFIGEE